MDAVSSMTGLETVTVHVAVKSCPATEVYVTVIVTGESVSATAETKPVSLTVTDSLSELTNSTLSKEVMLLPLSVIVATS